MPVYPSVSFLSLWILIQFQKIRRGEMKTEIEKNGNENDDRNGD